MPVGHSSLHQAPIIWSYDQAYDQAFDQALGMAKILNIGISQMQPKIVVMLVLGTPKHLELGLKLQNWPFAVHFKFGRF